MYIPYVAPRVFDRARPVVAVRRRRESQPIDPRGSFVLAADRIVLRRSGNVPPHSSETARLYGDIDRTRTYLVIMK